MLMHSVTRTLRASGSLFLIALAVGCRPAATVTPPPATAAVKPASRETVDRFCGGCHLPPQPSDFARSDWRQEVTQGFGLHAMSARVDLIPPALETVVAYYELQAPEALRWDETQQIGAADQPSPIAFTPLRIGSDTDSSSAIARIDWPDPDGPFYLSDIRGGHVWTWSPADTTARLLWTIPHPAAVCATRLGADQRPGHVIADLGSFLPQDHSQGKLWWIAHGDSRPPTPLIEELGRVSHVLSRDLDGDGTEDLLVSEFGWRWTGRLLILWGSRTATEPPFFETTTLDPRHGVLRTEVRD
ncbi:MAG TPA: hypothetical protein VM165_00400, partial [Planctomycetaceae bacterium]|nr:hypothetical protein [Planctomycetaceae bacterium]